MTGEDGLERYRIISTLGTGGMATVLLAEDQRLGRMVALKQLANLDGVLRQGTGRESDDALLSRLRREALLGASVSHPNLVSIYDIVSTEENGLVIVMEYVPGETLRDRMVREGRMPAEEALPILRGVASGLDAIHSRGIVHRDLKPANVLLGDSDVVKLADFGIATGAESTRITSQGAVVGTFRYMAPEQLEDAPSNPAMDIYALAVVALEMLSGERARPESHPIALAHALATQPPPDLRTTWPQAPAAAAEVLLRGMARDPAQRPRRAGELIGRLRSALEDETTRHPVGSRPVDRSPDRTAERDGASRDGAVAAVPPPPAAPSPRPAPPRAAPSPPPAPSRADPERLVPAAAAVTASARPAAPPRPRRANRGAGSALSAAAVSSRDDHPRRGAADRGANRRWRLGAPIALLAVLGGVAAAVIATHGSSNSPHGTRVSSVRTSTHRAKTNPASGRTSGAGASSSTKTSSSSSASSTSSSAGATSTAPAAGTGTAADAGTKAGAAARTTAGTKTTAGTNAAGGTTPASGTPAGSTSASATTPVQAVESFYHAAADHQYPSAWSLADARFQQQLGGYASFQAGQAGDRSITFNKATVTDQTATSATVAVQTTSERSNGTESCNGNVDLVKRGATWQLDQIGIDCS